MLPLAGVRVVEFCQVLAGPYCGMLLADLGAEVIKVEPPEGDMMRQWPPISEGYSENFASINRNKRSVVLDLKDPAQKAAARKLILTADVVLENNRPGVMDRLGLGYESFRAERPGLVYCSISAFGQSGPRSGEGGFDVTVQAMSGIMSVTGEPDGAPVKCGVPVSDTGTGLYAAFTIVSVLRRVAGGGAGAHIDASMLGCSLGMAALQTSEFFGTGNDPKKLGSAHPRNAPYQAFKCADGHFVIAAGNNKLWEAVTQVVGRPDLFADPRFATTQSRAANQGRAEGPAGGRVRQAGRRSLAGRLREGRCAAGPHQHLQPDPGRPAGRAHGLGRRDGASLGRQDEDLRQPSPHLRHRRLQAA